MHAGDGQHTTEKTYDTESDEEISIRSDPKNGGKFFVLIESYKKFMRGSAGCSLARPKPPKK